MGKGSGVCQRPGITLEASDSASPELTLSMDVTEINTTLELQRFEGCWWTKDERVSYQKIKEGWTVFSYSTPVRKAFEEYGIVSTIEGEPTCFPSLREAQKAVNDVSLEAGLNIDSGLTRQKYISYKIGDFPFAIMREEDHWRVYMISLALSPSLKKHFNSTQEFLGAWESTDIRLAHHITQKAAHQAVINWLSQTIAEGK